MRGAAGFVGALAQVTAAPTPVVVAAGQVAAKTLLLVFPVARMVGWAAACYQRRGRGCWEHCWAAVMGDTLEGNGMGQVAKYGKTKRHCKDAM